MTRRLLRMMFLLLLVTLEFTPAIAEVVRIKPSGDDASDGTSWSKAKKTIQAAVNSASPGSELWIAAGTYAATTSSCFITLKSGVSLYGGFFGNETIREQRNAAINLTILDGGGLTTLISVATGAAADTVIDGFTIRGGAKGISLSFGHSYGGGVFCNGSSPTISNNTFTGNSTSYAGGAIGLYNSSARIVGNFITSSTSGYGAGVYSYDGAPVISNNRFAYNRAGYGGGVYCERGSPVIANSIIYGCVSSQSDGSAIYASGCTASIVNNTIVGNQSDGEGSVRLGGGTCTFSNNILANNSTGLLVAGGTHSIRNNCFFDNGHYDFKNYYGTADLIAGNNNIKQDPVFVNLALANFHIQQNSPCVETGDNSAAYGNTDNDGQNRIIGSKVDIGADEFFEPPADVPTPVFRVSVSGADWKDGSSWANAKRTIQAAVNAASVNGGEVWVKAGTYREKVTINPSVYLYGGFSGSETEKSARNWSNNSTIIQTPQTDQSAVAFAQSGRLISVIDGFTIRGGIGGGFCAPTIVNNVITGSANAGIAFNDAVANVANNTIIRNKSGIGCYGYYCELTISNNVVSENSGDGIYVYSSYHTAMNLLNVSNNVVRSNAGTGIRCSYIETATVENNCVIGNCAGISACGKVIGNTIVGNSSSALTDDSSSKLTDVVNNVIAFNQAGIYFSGVLGSPLFKNNCIYGNYDYNYKGFADATGTNGNISSDPKLANAIYGDMHLRSDSPCIDTGDDAVVPADSLDIDGKPRVEGIHVDIGADEWAAGDPVAPCPVLRVCNDGNDSNDGSSWVSAKRTVQAAVDALSTSGGEVWVKSGTYAERITLRSYIYLYGGFAGLETNRCERDWTKNKTTLDGGRLGSVVTLISGFRANAVDGFTVRNGGPITYGGGISCNKSSPFIANNSISCNMATYGGGIYCNYSLATITNNNIVVNAASNGAGIYCLNSSPQITNNTFSGNVAGSGGSIYVKDSSASISNNIIAFNSSGIFNSYGSTMLRNNDLYGNAIYNYSGISAGKGDISADPLFANRGFGNYHLTADSACINAGWNDASSLPGSDIDGKNRIEGVAVDIGADESDGNNPPLINYPIIRCSTSGNDSNDGSSWNLAKRTVQAAIDTASLLGGEVWVKAGTYNERVTPRSYVYLYGGFAGTETALVERDWTKNKSIIDGSNCGAVVIVNGGYQVNTIDGFVIRNGNASSNGGIYCNFSSPSIQNNTIAWNVGSGIHCNSSQPTITNNTIVGNSASGIYCSSSPTIVTNNTIIANGARSGGAIYCYDSSSQISNNIIAFNASGISNSSSSSTLRNNDVFGNTIFNYSGISAGVGDISVDPLFVNKSYGDYHLTAGSACINAGWDNALALPSVDADGQERVQAETVDIGADESDGCDPPVAPHSTIHVANGGNDYSDGSSWALAKRTVQAAVNAVGAQGGEIWVKSGTYKELVTLPPYVYLYGGFTGTEIARFERCSSENETVLDGGNSGSVVSISSGYQLNILDGFTVCNGSATSGGGILCYNSSPIISNNIVVGNSATNGGGIYCDNSCATITNNRIVKNTSNNGAIFCGSTSVRITNNTVVGNVATFGGGICCLSGWRDTISNNILAFNSAGLYMSGSSCVLRNNDVYGNTDYNYSGISAGIGDISIDPLFVSKNNNNYHIKANSTCINAGWNDAPAICAVDIDCQNRIQGGAVDIGADEWWPPLSEAKTASENSQIDLSSMIVTAAYPGSFYIESGDRTSGIRVEEIDHSLSLGMRAEVSGSVRTNSDGERYIAATNVCQSGRGLVLPLAMNNRFVGGGTFGYQLGVWSWTILTDSEDTPQYSWIQATGLSNIGLLIKTWGKVTYANADYFYIDDGSDLDDNSGHKGLKVYGCVGSGTFGDPIGKMVCVTGISSCEKSGSDLVRVIRTRGTGDVVFVSE